jgi:hypothetical protein
MTTTENTKTRTAALPNLNKTGTPGRTGNAKTEAQASGHAWSGIVFGPYLVPLTRRAE